MTNDQHALRAVAPFSDHRRIMYRKIVVFLTASLLSIAALHGPSSPSAERTRPTLHAQRVAFHTHTKWLRLLAKWQRVAVCEQSGNWHVHGSKYSGGLGLTNYNWTFYSRGMHYPANAGDATKFQQVVVAERLVHAAGLGNWVPDQHGCAPW